MLQTPPAFPHTTRRHHHAQDHDRRRRPGRAATGHQPAPARLPCQHHQQPHTRGPAHRQGAVQPVHVPRQPAARTRPRAQLLGTRLPAGRGHLVHGAPPRAARRKGHELGPPPGPQGAVGRPACEGARLDGRVRPPGRRAADARSRHGRSGALDAGPRSRDRGRRQGRDRPDVPARRQPQPLRQAAARTGTDLCARHGAPPRVLSRQLQPHSRRGRVLRVPGADRQWSLRDHGVRGRARWSHGLLGRCGNAGPAPDPVQRNPGQVPALGSGPLHAGGVDRRQRHPRRALRPHGAPAGGPAAQRPGGDGHGRRGDAQRPHHRPGLQQRGQVCECGGTGDCGAR